MLAACRQAYNSPRTCARPAANGNHVAKLHTGVPRLPPPPAAAHGADQPPSDRGLQPAVPQAEPKGPSPQPRPDPTDSTTPAPAAEAAGSAAPGVASTTGSSSSPAADSPSAAPTVAAGNDTGINSSRVADSPSASPTTAEDPGNSPSAAAPTEGDPDDMDLPSILAALQGMGGGIFDAATELEPPKEPLLPSFDLPGVAAHLGGGKAAKVVVMCGAGISVSAGIPDFRTPGTGLYDQLERYNLPNPEAVFEINYFKRNPKPFHMLAKELFPGNYTPTPTHVFLRLLSDKGLLRRVYTQNIDSLEGQAGVPRELIVAAHGNFDAARCIKCGAAHTTEYVKEAVMSDKICHCSKERCGGLVKPDIVFFGEQLPDRFYDLYEEDFGGADLLMVMGTSLVVNPFASLIDAVDQDVPRLLINRERVGEAGSYRGMFGKGFVFPPPSYYAPSDTPGAGAADAPAGTTGVDSSSTAAAPGPAGKPTKGDNSSSKGGKGSEEGEGSSKTAGDNSNSSSSSGGASSGGSAGAGGGAADAGKAAAATEAGPEPAAAAGSSTTGAGKPSSPSQPSTPPAAADAPAATQSAAAAAKQSQERERGRCYRDALFLGDCDEGVSQLVDLLGWRAEFEQLLAEVRAAHPGGPHVAAEGHVLGDNIEEEQVPDTM